MTRGSEETRSDGNGEDQPMHGRMSPEHRERIRELFETDMNVRTELATAPAGEEPLRGLPSFEVELGPDGRAYAVEPGVKFDPPKQRVIEPPPAPDVDAPHEQPPPPPVEPSPVDAAPVEQEEAPPPRVAEPEKAEAAEPKPVEAEDEDAATVPLRFAEAYRAAAVLPRAPGGFTDVLG